MTPEESMPMRRPLPEGARMMVWVIYQRPRDYPNGYVLRAQFAMRDGTVQPDVVAWHADDPEKLRAIIPGECLRWPRCGQDDPAILETWL